MMGIPSKLMILWDINFGKLFDSSTMKCGNAHNIIECSIQAIVEQGGSQETHTAMLDTSKLAHLFKFQEILCGKELVVYRGKLCSNCTMSYIAW
jgi:hypothetical protein